jgi:hypothetical protein
MTGQEFMDWLVKSQQCETELIEGRNITGFSIRIKCKKTGRTFYFSGPFGYDTVPKFVIVEICDELWLATYPPGH